MNLPPTPTRPLLFITLPHFSSLEPILASCLAVLGSLCTACPVPRTGPPWGRGPVGLVYHDVPGTGHPGSARHREGTRQVFAEQEEQTHCGDTGSGQVSRRWGREAMSLVRGRVVKAGAAMLGTKHRPHIWGGPAWP